MIKGFGNAAMGVVFAALLDKYFYAGHYIGARDAAANQALVWLLTRGVAVPISAPQLREAKTAGCVVPLTLQPPEAADSPKVVASLCAGSKGRP